MMQAELLLEKMNLLYAFGMFYQDAEYDLCDKVLARLEELAW